MGPVNLYPGPLAFFKNKETRIIGLIRYSGELYARDYSKS